MTLSYMTGYCQSISSCQSHGNPIADTSTFEYFDSSDLKRAANVFWGLTWCSTRALYLPEYLRMANVCDGEQARWCSTDGSIIDYDVRKCCVHTRLRVTTTPSLYLSSHKTVPPFCVRDPHWANGTSWVRCRMNLPQMSSNSEERHLNIYAENPQ